MNRRGFLRSAGALALVSRQALGQFGQPGSVTWLGPATGGEIGIAVVPGAAGRIGERFCGFSYEKDQVASPMFTKENRKLIGLYRRLGPGVLRLGGNQVDRTTWERAGTGRAAGKIAPADVDGVGAFARATGWKVLYGVNLAQSTPALAADEVAYATRAIGESLAGIEIGNEPDGFVSAKYFPATWKYPDYIARWRGFADAILARTPQTVLTGPATAYDTNWFKSFAGDAPKQVRLLTHHSYRGNGLLASSDAKLLISYPDAGLERGLAKLGEAANAANLPFRLAETNSFYNGGSPNVSNSYASALWAIDFLFTLAAGGCQGANFHGGGNGKGYTPIGDDRGSVVGPRPLYCGIYLFTLAGQGKLLACRCDAGGLNVTAYAVETDSGRLNAMVVNKEPRGLPVALDLTGWERGGSLRSASVTRMSDASLSATEGTTIGGSAIEADGSIARHEPERIPVGKGRLRLAMPPLSAALVELG